MCVNGNIYLFGPSCSGKSTLGQALQQSFGSQWTYLDRDVLIEKGLSSEARANAALDEKVELIKNRMIIDAQIPWREKRKDELYFLVLPPLNTLLERDATRTLRLKRTEQRAKYARDYVVKTHQILDQMDKGQFDICFDSSQISVQDEVNAIKSLVLEQSKTQMQTRYVCLAISGLAFSLICALFISRKLALDELK
jgi:hypothetical protein